MAGPDEGRDETFARLVRRARAAAAVLVLLMPLRDTAPPPGAPSLLTAALVFSSMMLALNAWSLWRSRRDDHSLRRRVVEAAAELVAALVTAAVLHHLATFEVTPGYLMVAAMLAGLRLGMRHGVALVAPAAVVLVVSRVAAVPPWVVPPGVDPTDLGLVVPPVVALLVLTSVTGLAVDAMRAAEARAEEARNRVEVTNTALRRTNDALRRFARTIAHDLRAPLASAAGSAELVRDRGNQLTAAQLQQVTDTLAHSARRASELVTDMLDVAEGTDQRRLVISDLRAWLLTLLGPVLAERGGTLEVRADRASSPAAAGPVRALLLNLVTNAVKHHAPTETPPAVVVTIEHDEDRVRIDVDDNGRGIPDAQRSDVLRPGVRGDTADATGTGHGLTEVHRSVTEELGGTLSIDDSPLGGARITVSLPLRHDQPSAEGSDADRSSPFAQR